MSDYDYSVTNFKPVPHKASFKSSNIVMFSSRSDGKSMVWKARTISMHVRGKKTIHDKIEGSVELFKKFPKLYNRRKNVPIREIIDCGYEFVPLYSTIMKDGKKTTWAWEHDQLDEINNWLISQLAPHEYHTCSSGITFKDPANKVLFEMKFS